FILSNGMPTPPPAELGPGFGAVPVGSPVILNPDFIAQNHQTPYSHQFNLSLQKQLTGRTLLEIEYLGNISHRISGQDTVNSNEVRPEQAGATQNQRLRPFP